MDALDIAILALRIALVLVLYAFLLFVLRTARSMLAETDSASGAAPGRGLAPDHARIFPRPVRLQMVDPGSSGLRPGAVIAVPDGAIIGRGADCDVVLADSTVSSHHVQVWSEQAQWVARDLGSTNGTLLNGEPLTDAAGLKEGDELAIGAVRVRITA